MPRLHGMKAELLHREQQLAQYFDQSNLNQIINASSKNQESAGIITSGIAYLHIRQAMQELNVNLPNFKLAVFHPLPEKTIKNFIQGLKKVLVLEELEPYLERRIEMLARQVNCSLEIHGADFHSPIGELKPEIAADILAKFLGKNYSMPHFLPPFEIPNRPPQLCPGCPYWLTFAEVKKPLTNKK